MLKEKQEGVLLVLSGPSGVGKGTICQHLLDKRPSLKLSVSVTTRSPRLGEEEGVHYYFITSDEFERLRQADELLEWAEVFGNFYATPRAAVNDALQAGQDMILEIDVQGALQVKKAFPAAILVFVWPPSLEILEQRILNRGTESDEARHSRLNKAHWEMGQVADYDYLVVNHENQAEFAATEVETIFKAEKLRVERRLAKRCRL